MNSRSKSRRRSNSKPLYPDEDHNDIYSDIDGLQRLNLLRVGDEEIHRGGTATSKDGRLRTETSEERVQCVCAAARYSERERVHLKISKERIQNEFDRLRKLTRQVFDQRSEQEAAANDLEAREQHVLQLEKYTEERRQVLREFENRLMNENKRLKQQREADVHQVAETQRMRHLCESKYNEVLKLQQTVQEREAALLESEANIERQNEILDRKREKLSADEAQLMSQKHELDMKEESMRNMADHISKETENLQNEKNRLKKDYEYINQALAGIKAEREKLNEEKRAHTEALDLREDELNFRESLFSEQEMSKQRLIEEEKEAIAEKQKMLQLATDDLEKSKKEFERVYESRISDVENREVELDKVKLDLEARSERLQNDIEAHEEMQKALTQYQQEIQSSEMEVTRMRQEMMKEEDRLEEKRRDLESMRLKQQQQKEQESTQLFHDISDERKMLMEEISKEKVKLADRTYELNEREHKIMNEQCRINCELETLKTRQESLDRRELDINEKENELNRQLSSTDNPKIIQSKFEILMAQLRDKEEAISLERRQVQFSKQQMRRELVRVDKMKGLEDERLDERARKVKQMEEIQLKHNRVMARERDRYNHITLEDMEDYRGNKMSLDSDDDMRNSAPFVSDVQRQAKGSTTLGDIQLHLTGSIEDSQINRLGHMKNRMRSFSPSNNQSYGMPLQSRSSTETGDVPEPNRPTNYSTKLQQLLQCDTRYADHSRKSDSVSYVRLPFDTHTSMSEQGGYQSTGETYGANYSPAYLARMRCSNLKQNISRSQDRLAWSSSMHDLSKSDIGRQESGLLDRGISDLPHSVSEFNDNRTEALGSVAELFNRSPINNSPLLTTSNRVCMDMNNDAYEVQDGCETGNDARSDNIDRVCEGRPDIEASKFRMEGGDFGGNPMVSPMPSSHMSTLPSNTMIAPVIHDACDMSPAVEGGTSNLTNTSMSQDDLRRRVYIDNPESRAWNEKDIVPHQVQDDDRDYEDRDDAYESIEEVVVDGTNEQNHMNGGWGDGRDDMMEGNREAGIGACSVDDIYRSQTSQHKVNPFVSDTQ